MPKSNKKVFYTVFSVISILLAIALGACAVFCTGRYYEPDIAFFERGAMVPQIMLYALTVLSALCLLIGFIMNRGNSEERYDRPRLTGPTLYSGLLAGFSLIAADALFLLDLYRSEEAIMFASASDLITAVMLILAVPAALYFFSTSFGASERSTGATVLGMFVVLWAAAFLLRLYFNMDLSLKSPTRILGQMVPIAIMCYFVQELRYRIGRARPALFHSFSAVAIMLIAVSAAIEITAAVKYGTTDTDRAFKLAELCIGIYILLSTFHLPSAVTEGPSSDRRTLKERRLMREEDDDSYLDGLADNDVTLGDIQQSRTETDRESAFGKDDADLYGMPHGADEPDEGYDYDEASRYSADFGYGNDFGYAEYSESREYGATDVRGEDAGTVGAEDRFASDSEPIAEEQSVPDAEPITEEAASVTAETSVTETPTSETPTAEERSAPDAEPIAEEAPQASAEDAPAPHDGVRRAEVRKGLSVGAARRAESFISRMLEEESQLQTQDDEFDTSCSMEEEPDEAEDQ